MRKMNENWIILGSLLIMVSVGGLFLHGNLKERLEDKTDSTERSKKDKRSLIADNRSRSYDSLKFRSFIFVFRRESARAYLEN